MRPSGRSLLPLGPLPPGLRCKRGARDGEHTLLAAGGGRPRGSLARQQPAASRRHAPHSTPAQPVDSRARSHGRSHDLF
eukprot:COSAG01_NODE_1039_length_11962_cov_32.853494_3_plen_79_part_00